MYPASNTMVAAWIPSAERGLANGIIFAGVGFGAGITPPLITYVLVTYGWRASFWVSAAVGLIAGAIWYVLARNRPSEHPWVSVDEQNYIKAGLPAHAEKSGERLSLSTIVRNPQILAVTFSYFTFGYVAYIFFSWFFIYLSSVRGLNLKQSAFYSMLPFLAMSAGSTVGGWISDRLVARWGARVGRSYFSMVSLALAAIFLGLGTQVQSAELASVVLAGGAGSLYLSQSCFWSVSADIGGSSAGLVSGVMNMGAQIGGAVTASLTPVIANEFGWTASFLVAAGLSAVGALAWIPVRSQDRSSLAVDKAPSPITH
jgi:ACS family glucarate transporter-like MFS transporter